MVEFQSATTRVQHLLPSSKSADFLNLTNQSAGGSFLFR